MKRLFYICILLQLASCKSLVTTLTTYETPDTSGHWKLKSTETVEYIPFLDRYAEVRAEDGSFRDTESSPYEYATNFDLIFSADTVYYLNYPMELAGIEKYSIDTAHLHFEGSTWPIFVKGDTMIIYRDDELYSFQKLVYHKTHFNDSIVSVLKRDTLNYGLLADKWFLLRSYSYNYGMEYELDFPHEIPDSIVLSRDEILSNLNTDKSIEMMTDGVKKKYTIGYIDGELHLTPGPWYRGQDPNIHFWRRRTFLK